MFRSHTQDLGGGCFAREDRQYRRDLIRIGEVAPSRERQGILHNSSRNCTWKCTNG